MRMAVRYYSHRHIHTYEGARYMIVDRIAQIAWFLLAVVEAVLVLRFGLRLLGATAATPFANFIYVISDFFLYPFRYIAPAAYVAGATLEWMTLIAMFVYWLAATLAVNLVYLARPLPPAEREVVEEA